ncbi:hypothetical protein [Latilactobacillus sakei]|uniref:hypothetical protein n=1 Tax=Latilactobacillus sakei TaxID=1599 RepID=UPI0024DFA5B1|nr:hypothetical protein [Latilactobacillus sakei]
MNNNVPQIRFNGYSDAWEERKFENNIVSIQTGTNLLGTDANEGTPLLKMGNFKGGIFLLISLNTSIQTVMLNQKILLITEIFYLIQEILWNLLAKVLHGLE